MPCSLYFRIRRGSLGAAVAILLLLTALGALIRWLASKAPRPKHPLLRLALTSLHRPGAQTGQLVVALGLGLTLFATLAAIQTSLTNEIRSTVPRDAPSFFVLAKDERLTMDYLRAYLLNPHPPMPNPDLPARTINDLGAYIHSLR